MYYYNTLTEDRLVTFYYQILSNLDSLKDDNVALLFEFSFITMR